MPAEAEIGIIGGSGLYALPGIEDGREVKLETPFGAPSDAYFVGRLEGRRVAFLARHGRGHRLLPSELNFRANLYGFKLLGVEQIISVSAVGSLKEELRPLDFVLPDQFIDRTRGRISTFFGDGLVAHIGFAEPICARLRAALASACRSARVQVHDGGVYLCMEGPAFSTRAESRLYRSWGVDVIGMTNLQEAKLAREACLCFATVAMVTDFDCWHPGHAAVTIQEVLSNLQKNADNAARVIRAALAGLGSGPRGCGCARALEHALVTDPALVPDATWRKLAPILGPWLRR